MKILIIEDNPDHAEIIIDTCEEAFGEQCKPTLRVNFNEGIKTLSKAQHDIALVDLQFPDSALDQTEAYLSKHKFDIPIIVLTSLNDDHIGQRLVEHGIQDYLPKESLSAMLLQRMVLYAMERKKQQLKLEALTENQNNFCRSLSHDFKAPIRNISQLTKLLHDRMTARDVLNEDERQLIEMISERAGFMHELVEGLYHYILVEQAPDRQQESIDLDTLIHDVIAQNMNDRYTQDTIKVVSPLPSITGYYSQLFILFQNLIANALKYCQQAPQITIDCSTVESSDNIDYCEISIKDNGIGIDTDSMDRIFHPFVRGNTHGEFKGAGLGLSVVNRIVKNHQGFIDVESVLGEGSNFRVCLPLTK